MRSSLVRSPAVRQLTARRFASTGSETAAKATSEASAKAQEASKKAQDAVKVAAGKLGAAASGVGNSLMKVGGRTGKLIHTISGECLSCDAESLMRFIRIYHVSPVI